LHNAGLAQVEVEIIGSDAYLKGQVTTAEEKGRAVQITESDAPVTVRTNLIRIVPGDIFGF
jgi:osmotically-inducible protein OsmY